MRAFKSAVELGSFSKAAQATGVKVSTVSRYVTALEHDLAAALFNRSTRRLHLTEAGTHFYEHAVRILAEVAEARSATHSLNERPQGLLRVNMPIAFGRRHILPHLKDFLAEYPDIRIEAVLTDETVDLIASGADVAVRIGALADSRLVAKRLAPHRRLLVATLDYLTNRRPIREPRDLLHHECLAFSLQAKQAWFFWKQDENRGEPLAIAVDGRFSANNSEVLLDTALAGMGIALLPTWLTGDAISDRRLVIILPAWEARLAVGPERAIWGVYPPKKIVPPKVRAFLSLLEQRFGRPAYWDQFDRGDSASIARGALPPRPSAE